jgi:hypothetical protein
MAGTGKVFHFEFIWAGGEGCRDSNSCSWWFCYCIGPKLRPQALAIDAIAINTKEGRKSREALSVIGLNIKE